MKTTPPETNLLHIERFLYTTIDLQAGKIIKQNYSCDFRTLML